VSPEVRASESTGAPFSRLFRLPPLLAAATRFDREVGITTSSFSGHSIELLELPRIVRNELGMRVIDLNTTTLRSLDPAALNRFRESAEKAGCVLTNLKMNQRDLDMNSPDSAERRRALDEYKRTIDAAAHLGCRWARPLPRKDRPDLSIHVASYRELADHALSRGVQMLVENFGWMETEAGSIPEVIKAVGRNIAASPDTGNWSDNAIRYQGLAAAFPLAATCDFKAMNIEPDGEHPVYDLKRCFQIGWSAGFRGPWCLEILEKDRTKLFRNLILVRDRLRGWMKG
jgi:Xylose isomerase-like TIM barrel